MSITVLTRNVTALREAGCPIPAAVLRTPEDADVLSDAGKVVGVALRTPTGPVPLQAASQPVREAEGWVAAPVLDASTVAVIGGGAGHVMEALEHRGYGGRVLVLEPSPGACVAALARRDWTPDIQAGRLRWLVGPSYDGWTDAWSWLTPGEAPGIVIHPVLARLRAPDVRAALEVLKKLVFNAGANERARRQFAGPYLLNTLTNLPHLLRSHDVRDVAGHFAGVPAVVAAAGPSLNRNLDELRPVRDRALLVAVDTALRPCLAAGIEPDFVVAVDPGDVNRRHLDVGRAPVRTRFVAEPSVAPGSFDAFSFPWFTFCVGDHEPWPWLRACGVSRGRLRAWGSVLTSSLDFTVSLGCDPVVLIGADFAYTDEQPYCRGTAYEEDWARMVAGGMSLEQVWSLATAGGTSSETDLRGATVRTSPQLTAFRDWVEEYCLSHQAPATLNATGAGVLRRLNRADLVDVLGSRPGLGSRLDDVVATIHEERPLAASTWGFEQEPPTPWHTWATATGRSILELVSRLEPALTGEQWDSLSDAYASHRLTSWSRSSSAATGRDEATSRALPATQTQSVRHWRRLHDEGYLTKHPVVGDPANTLGLDGLLRHLAPTPDDVLLELGCGRGRLLQHLAPRVRVAIGVDLAPQALELAAVTLRGQDNVRLVLGNGLSLHPVEDGEISALFSVAVLQHLPRQATADYLAECARVLRQGGRACLSFFSDGSGDADVVDAPGEQSISYTAVQLCELVEAAGLRLRRLEREGLDDRYPGANYSTLWIVCERP